MTSQWQLRAAFAARLSDMYGREVPAYTTLVDVSREVNEDVLRARGADAERLGSISRVTAERHGAIRVGTPQEMQQVARIFGALGMRPVGFYDLREAAASAVPVISTAFRPTSREELARNPFRVFTSMLTPADPRFFDDDLRARLETFLAGRELFPPELLALADRAEAEGELPEAEAERFLQLAVHAFELSTEPVDKAWYERLERVSAVAADIGGVRSTHINHLTPRVLDIDELYRRMTERGIEMIDTIQGPPAWKGPDVLLRQTSFRALAEPRALRTPDGTVIRGALRVRFGEVEARGLALTREGRALYDSLLARIDEQASAHPGKDRSELAHTVWAEHMPHTEHELATSGLAYFTYHVAPDRPRDGSRPPTRISELVEQGWVRAEPIVYEDFLPRSAAGIFQSNLSGEGSRNNDQQGAAYDAAWLSGAIGREVLDPFSLYEQQQNHSIRQAARELELDGALDQAPHLPEGAS
ncbi:2-oxoadipate dioxygenase/decarboxylase [Streptomyces benahoarensis]|uniref:2-oxoadipate dioxygenase/decarboxylase n=1 Tax=Streptomyces benahoarensis TaxID=2595054 RepID=A0A553ZPV3_9ACTN|nr:VOC family protein [Streptomyces benahoarensis]TSB31552.1 VOC family protein [Streptomyces benahoarensis]TSB43494.1 VOC family protein [Streptomyces benahoarensis]